MTEAKPDIRAPWVPEEPVTPDVEQICNDMKSEIEKKAGTTFPHFTPTHFRSQTEAGTFYLVRVVTGENVCVHAIIFKSDAGMVSVTGVQYPKLINNPLIPF